MALADSLLHDGTGKAVDLDIHLDRCDTVVGTCYLEVHISEEVLKSLDICKDQIIIICLTCYKSY